MNSVNLIPVVRATYKAPTQAEIWEMLSYIPATERETWITIGMALKSEFSDIAFSMFDSWSQSAPNYNAKAVAIAWRSFNG